MNKPVTAESLIATPETDGRLMERYWNGGMAARMAGLPRESCPIQDKSCMIAKWWYSGYDSLNVNPV